MPALISALRTLLAGFGGKLLKGMGTLISTAFLSMFGSLVIKLFMSLGIGFYTYTELTNFFNTLINNYKSAYNSMPATILAFLDLGGFATGINIILSGVAFIVSYYSSKTAITFFGRAIT